MTKPHQTLPEAANGQQLFNESALRAMGIGASLESACAPLAAHPLASRVVIGFVDYGFDLLHPCLLDATGTKSRFKYLWDQNRTPQLVRQPHFDLAAAYDYSGDMINQLIAAAQVQPVNSRRTSLDAVYDPHANYYGRQGVSGGAHGTLMATIAAGTPYEGFRSPAPFADLIGVQLAVVDTDWREENADGSPSWRDSPDAIDGAGRWDGWRTYDACPQIAHGIRYIYDRGCKLGAELVVINLSIGTWAGAHDGQSLVEQAISQVFEASCQPGATACQIVVGAGNAGADQGHYTATLEPRSVTSFKWNMNRTDPTQNKLEIWYDGAPLEIELQVDGGRKFQIGVSATCTIESGGAHVGIADHTTQARGQLSRARVLLHPPYFPAADNGADVVSWTVTLSNSAATVSTVHAWVERDDGSVERSWLVPHSRENTLCCLATAKGAIVVAGGNHHTPDGALAPLPFSARGPAAWGHAAPVEALGSPGRPVVAPAYRIWGAQSKTGGFTETTGTSAAAALMSGVLAAEHVRAAHPATRPGQPPPLRLSQVKQRSHH
jgi:Subtilase family